MTTHARSLATHRRSLLRSAPWLAAAAAALAVGCSTAKTRDMSYLSKDARDAMKPEQVVDALKRGNQRFMSGDSTEWDVVYAQHKTADGQYPMAVVLECVDSRTPIEIVCNLRLGDVFNARVAGNVVNTDIAGSMEFACKVAGSKAVIVLGHTNCGAIKGACDHAELGNLTSLLSSIRPAVDAKSGLPGDHSSKNHAFVEAVAKENVILTVAKIREISPVLREMESKGEIRIVGAMYDLATGMIEFYEPGK